MILCWKYRRRLGAYADGELSRKDRHAVENHLRRCDACRAALKEIRGLTPVLENLEVPSPPPDLTARIVAEARNRKSPRAYGMAPSRSRWSPAPREWAYKGASVAALILGLTIGSFIGWSVRWNDRTLPSGGERDNIAYMESFYALDALSDAPRGSIEAASIILFCNNQ